MAKPESDPTIVKAQYRTSGNLEARIRLHQLFSTNKYGWFPWCFDHLELKGGMRVLELGCGVGSLWRENQHRLPAGISLTLTDLSAGMAQQAAGNLKQLGFAFALADAQAIPFGARAFDAVIANHMLYHVPDRERALAEIRRVLVPGGKLYATTIGLRHIAELDNLANWFLERTSPEAPQIQERNQSEAFTLENGGAQLSRWFDRVVMERYPDSLEVTQVQPLVDYILSMRAFMDVQPSNEDLRALEAAIEDEIRARGCVAIRKDSGMFIAQ